MTTTASTGDDLFFHRSIALAVPRYCRWRLNQNDNSHASDMKLRLVRVHVSSNRTLM